MNTPFIQQIKYKINNRKDKIRYYRDSMKSFTIKMHIYIYIYIYIYYRIFGI
jgi:hypothetical protein